jgi:hypothetical protein
MDWGTLAISIASGIVISFVTARLTVTGFCSQRLWELKLKAYCDILEALHQMKVANRHDWIAHENGGVLPECAKQMWESSREQISRVADLGDFTIHCEATAILRQFERDMASICHEQSFEEVLTEFDGFLDRCLSNIKPVAKRDLERTTGLEQFFQ